MQEKLPLDENDKRQLVLKLISRLRCMECGQLYKREDLTLVHRWEEIWLLNATCPGCSHSSHIVIFMQLDAQRELTTDLTPEELRHAGDWPPITADDILDVHALLEEFGGDFEELLSS